MSQGSQTLPSYFSKIHFIIIIPSMPSSCEFSPLQASKQKFCAHFSYPRACYILHPAHSSLDDPDNIRLRAACQLWRFFEPYVIPSLSRPNIFLSTLFSNALNLCSSFNTRNQVLHLLAYKANKTIVLRILILTFLDVRFSVSVEHPMGPSIFVTSFAGMFKLHCRGSCFLRGYSTYMAGGHGSYGGYSTYTTGGVIVPRGYLTCMSWDGISERMTGNTALTYDRVGATTVYVIWREHFWNVSVLQRAHL
jgi:hypothetical protein